MPQQPAKCAVQWVDAKRPLFLLYTSAVPQSLHRETSNLMPDRYAVLYSSQGPGRRPPAVRSECALGAHHSLALP